MQTATSTERKKIVVVGAGFAGLNFTKNFHSRTDYEIILVDRRNHHLFQPLLYQVATAGLSPADISMPIRSFFHHDETVRVVLDEVTGISPGKNQIQLKDGVLDYDVLVMACGASHSYFAHPEWEKFAPGLKSLEQATEIRRRVLSAFEVAEKTTDLGQQEAWMTFVIVGAGPTGVELAGAIAELRSHTIRDDFRNIDPTKAKIILVEAGPRVLASFHETLSERAKYDLENLGVQVMLNTRVIDLQETKMVIQSIETGAPSRDVSSRTKIWAAGVKPSITGKFLQESDSEIELDSSGRVMITPELNLKKYPNVFVLGDQSHFPESSGRGLPGVATVAIQQGRHASTNVARFLENKTLEPFSYFDKGTMATVGRKKAVLQTGKLLMTGFSAWLAWLLVHIYYLIGFRNRVFVLIQWFWSYLTFSRGARLITDPDWKLKP